MILQEEELGFNVTLEDMCLEQASNKERHPEPLGKVYVPGEELGQST